MPTFLQAAGNAVRRLLDDEIRNIYTPSRRVENLVENLCGITDIGSIRADNQDDFYLGPCGRFLVVADGMGGQAGGEVAARLSIESMAEVLTVAVDVDKHPAQAILCRAFLEAHHRVLQRASQDKSLSGMGAAAVAVMVIKDCLAFCNVGDARCYLHRDGEMNQLTVDHSTIEELIRKGAIGRAMAIDHPARGKLEQAIGGSRNFLPDSGQISLHEGDRVLLCSDGLWDSVSDVDIAELLSSEGSMFQIGSVLVDRALGAGGHDNITVVLYEHQGRNDRDCCNSVSPM